MGRGKSYKSLITVLTAGTLLLAETAFADPATSPDTESDLSASAAVKTTRSTTSDDALYQATENFKSLLKEAERTGFVLSHDQLKSRTHANKNSGTQAAVSAPPELKVECSDFDVLDFADLSDVSEYESVTQLMSEMTSDSSVSDIRHLARTYIALGLGAEARALVANRKDGASLVISYVGDMLSGIEPSSADYLFTPNETCSGQTELWTAVENPARVAAGYHQAGVENLMGQLAKYPVPLRTELMFKIGISAAENGQDALAKHMFDFLDVLATETHQSFEGREDYRYFLAHQIIKSNLPKSRALFNYIAERDGVYQAKSVNYLSKISMINEGTVSAALEAELEVVSQNRSRFGENKEAALQLVTTSLSRAQTIDAIRRTKKTLKPGDAEFTEAVSRISHQILTHLNDANLQTQVSGLNSYLEDPLLFVSESLRPEMQRRALKTAIAAGLPELGDMIYTQTPDLGPVDAARLNEARLMSSLKSGKLLPVSVLTQSGALGVSMKKDAVELAFQLQNYQAAKTLISALPEGEKRKEFEARYAVLNGQWRAASQHYDSLEDPKKIATDTAETQNENASLIKVVNFIDGVERRPAANTQMNDNTAVNALLGQLETDLIAVQEYLNDG